MKSQKNLKPETLKVGVNKMFCFIEILQQRYYTKFHKENSQRFTKKKPET